MMEWLCLFLFVSTTAHAFAPTNARQRTTSTFPLSAATASSVLEVGEEVGRGSYGRVHLCTLGDDTVICKRAYTVDELAEKSNDPKARVKRCQYYWDVERHCFEKLPAHSQIPTYRGVFTDEKGNEWMTFDVIQTNNKKDKVSKTRCCPTLQEVMDVDWQVQHEGQDHHLTKLQEALGLSETDNSFADVLDCVIESLLQVLSHVHAQGSIVHRDIKPGNLLLDPTSHSLVLIDFGSAADMDPIPSKGWFGGKMRVGLEDKRVALSPVYSAPEIFIDPDRYVVLDRAICCTVC